jgi:uncharacterized protein (TIGR02996 family)
VQHEDGFIAAIVKTPEDMSLRLIYADWLEERDDPRAEYLRLLCALAEWGGDPHARLRALSTNLDPEWLEQMHRGMSRAGLEYGNGSHNQLQMGGRRVSLRALRQWHTYWGLLEGTPDRRLNDCLIEDAVAKGRGQGQGREPHLIAPSRRDYLQRPGDMAEIDAWYRRPSEWLPTVVCVATFTALLSELTVVWFQDEYAPPIEEPTLNELRKLDWQALATQFEAEDL